MNLLPLMTYGITLRPSIKQDNECLIISTSPVTSVVSLWSSLRTIRINTLTRTVTISCRTAWFFKRRSSITFENIAYIDYSFDSFGTGAALIDGLLTRKDQLESFSISIVTRDSKKHPVCTFNGDGITGWAACLADQKGFSGADGSQEKESRAFALYLSRVLGVTIGKSVGSMADMRACPECRRANSPYKPSCLYCGAALASPDSRQQTSPFTGNID